MRVIFLLAVILLASCENKKDTLANRQQEIKKEMEQVKAAYYKKLDSLETSKKTNSDSATQVAIAEAFVSADKKRIAVLIPLQREYDSLQVELQNY